MLNPHLAAAMADARTADLLRAVAKRCSATTPRRSGGRCGLRSAIAGMSPSQAAQRPLASAAIV
jgi:hypothetical protein